MTKLEQNYKHAMAQSQDMGLFLPTLKDYSQECEHVTEFGVRWIVSTWGLLSGMPKIMHSYDINHPEVHGAKIEEAYEIAKENNIEYKFILASTLEIEIEQTDLLLIDTDHTYEQLKAELNLHHSKVNKYIICHDTIAFPNMYPAIPEFLNSHPEWSTKEHLTEYPGLIILEKK
jgi:cephalosporin hydroxylase